MMDLFGKKRSESFDSCCSGMDDHLNHHRPSHPNVHFQLNNGVGMKGHNGLGGNGVIGGGGSKSTPVVGAIPENKVNTSTRSSTGASSSGSRRKVSRWDQAETNHSSGSLLSTMQRFVQTVDDMNETILVPCRLMDLKFDEKSSKSSTPITNNVNDPKGHLMTNLNGVDLFQFYAVLNSVKNDLMWGSKQVQPSSGATNNSSSNNNLHHHGSISSTSSSSSSASSISSASREGNASSASLASAASSNNSNTVNNSSSPTATNGEQQQTQVKGHVRRPSTVSTTSSASASDTEFSELNEDSGLEGEEEYSQQMSDSFHHHLNGLQHCLRELTLAADYITTRYNNDLGGLNL